ncbi:hypothetical protein BCR44DRAFT_1260758 [Catenaria anguillulae PL171]|uniref:Uncharacterized protein n=1 Tax=Catenaria anguillulae PL171 TaxID=765915 RepID=A0A1Y2HB99_9FUNG|nr:hypothetical protein BCR44DRAFT_1260758 [Catenaria anguillulae PL171]
MLPLNRASFPACQNRHQAASVRATTRTVWSGTLFFVIFAPIDACQRRLAGCSLLPPLLPVNDLLPPAESLAPSAPTFPPSLECQCHAYV